MGSNSNSSTSVPVRVTSRSNFDAVCTTMGGLDSSCYRGYIGTWTSFKIPDRPVAVATACHTTPTTANSMPHHSPDSAAGHAQAAMQAETATEMQAAPAAAAVVIQPEVSDETVNLRLFRLEDPATSAFRQVNLYQAPHPTAAVYKPYITADKQGGRADGYSMREWTHDPSGQLWNTDGSSWRCGTAGTAEKKLVTLAVPRCSAAFICGALPSSFTAGHDPPAWHMEVIFKQPGSNARRWAVFNQYSHGVLVKTVMTNEDLIEVPADELHSHCINPGSITWQPRRDGNLGDIDAFAKVHVHPQGTATTFTFDEQHQLTLQTTQCSWSGAHVAAMSAAAAAAAAHHNQQLPAAVLQLSLPDCGYSRVPLELSALTGALATSAGRDNTATPGDHGIPAADTATQDTAAGTGTDTVITCDSVTFELGVVLTDGSLARWLLEYDTTGSRLLRQATYELYPAISAAN